MKLSFIVITYKRGALLQDCLDSIYAQEELPRPCEIILVDNGGDAKVRPPTDPDVHLVVERPGDNLGVAGGRNLGIELAQGEYLIFIDDDAVWHRSDDVARLLTYLDKDPRCGAVAVKSLAPNGDLIVSELPHPDKEFAQELDEPTEVPYFYGVGHALRAEAVRLAGDYPARFFYAMEEVDLSLRLVDAKYHILYAPGVAVHHYKSNLGRPVVGARYWKNNAVNKSRMAWRLLPLPYPLTIMFVWSAAVFVKTRSLSALFEVWRVLWAERELLARERAPIKPETVRYLKRIGARLLY